MSLGDSAGVVAMVILLVVVDSCDLVEEAMGGWNWAAAAFAVIDAVLTIFGSIWLLSIAQRRLDFSYRWGPRLSRSAYGASGSCDPWRTLWRS